ncbi:SusC/RagA family TonB-linked outer membrane protein [Pedobacter sp.]|uniref:SusC/RagA family TonB-linked outer membrane protein n=1 Tax=Pedobacter sp. TaxID=1411316 RepID=UPI0031D8D507
MMKNYTQLCANEYLVHSFKKGWMLKIFLSIASLLFIFNTAFAQQKRLVRGKVIDEKTAEGMYGVTITLKGTKTNAMSNADGQFTIEVPTTNATLVFAFVGMVSKEVAVGDRDNIVVSLKEDDKLLDQVVVVGYGQQKKSTVVGAVTQTTGKALERAGGVTNLGMALTGNLPGVVTTSTTGMPGAEDPQILIRGRSTWNNNSSPLILVDGIERSISSIDISSVESVSVLKDASATAVYGVRGANGVILVTTKTGVEGRAQVFARSNATMKVPSKLPAKYDSYDALMIKNRIIERESIVNQAGWSSYTPMQVIDKYRNPLNATEWDRYPNVDWEKELFNDYAMSYNTSANVSGGSKFVNYFVGLDFAKEGDLFKSFPNNRGYTAHFGYNRTNVRSNLDFNLTKTTKLSAKLYGSNGVRQVPYDMPDGDQSYWASAYRTAPDSFRMIYSDGTYGYYSQSIQDQPNAAFWLAYSGVEYRTSTQLTTDFVLQQKLDMITKGLSLRASISLDNSFLERRRGINDQNNPAQRKYVSPLTGNVVYEREKDPGTQFDFSDQVKWALVAGEVNKDLTYRNNNYQFHVNYDRTFGQDHYVTALGLVERQRNVTGSGFPRFRESWVFRTTYAYKSKYLFEANGAYNGSEKFGPDFRFALFPSFSAGWVITNESFMKNIKFLDLLKVRASWGRIGDDNINTARWPFLDSYTYNGNTQMGSTGSALTNTPYTFYRISSMGNPNLSWETVEKRNLGIEYSFLKGKISGNVDFFQDKRDNIMISGNSRAIPTFYGFGSLAPSANLGKASTKGVEFELKFNHSFNKNIRVWASTAITRAVSHTNFRDDPEFMPAYQKQEGYAIGQYRSFINKGFLASWDDIYGSTTRLSNNQLKLPGDYNIIDFNGDGVIDDRDSAPYGFTSNPENTYNLNLGFEWKRLSIFVQFYGVNNVTRDIEFPNYQGQSNIVFVERPFWYLQDGGGEVSPPRFGVGNTTGLNGTRYLYDASYIRLKNAEIAYSLSGNFINRMGIKNLRLYINGNNLVLWSKLRDDRESNFSGVAAGGAYPTIKRYNFGLDITL